MSIEKLQSLVATQPRWVEETGHYILDLVEDIDVMYNAYMDKLVDGPSVSLLDQMDQSVGSKITELSNAIEAIRSKVK
jgi:hypothetical protein